MEFWDMVKGQVSSKEQECLEFMSKFAKAYTALSHGKLNDITGQYIVHLLNKPTDADKDTGKCCYSEVMWCSVIAH